MADLEFRRLLQDYHATGDPESSAKMFHMGQRLGFSLADYRDYGVHWEDVSANLWQLNDVFLNPEEETEYIDYLHENTKSGPYAARKKEQGRLFARATGDWHPTWPLGRVYVVASYLGLYDKEYQRALGWGTFLRLAFWGMDDTGYEMNLSPDSEHRLFGKVSADRGLEVFESVIRALPDVISINWLRNHGFQPA